MGSRTRAFWLLFTLNLDGYCKRRTVKTTKDVQRDLRFMSQDLKVRNQWKHSGAIACNTWNVWCRTPRSITFASGWRGERGNYTCKVAMEKERRVCVSFARAVKLLHFPRDGRWRVIEFQANGSQLAFRRQSARLTGNTNHSLVSPTRFATFWPLASRGWLITDISALPNGTCNCLGWTHVIQALTVSILFVCHHNSSRGCVLPKLRVERLLWISGKETNDDVHSYWL